MTPGIVTLVCKSPGPGLLPVAQDVKMLDADGNDLFEKMTVSRLTIFCSPDQVVTATIEIINVEFDVEAEPRIIDRG